MNEMELQNTVAELHEWALAVHNARRSLPDALARRVYGASDGTVTIEAFERARRNLHSVAATGFVEGKEWVLPAAALAFVATFPPTVARGMLEDLARSGGKIPGVLPEGTVIVELPPPPASSLADEEARPRLDPAVITQALDMVNEEIRNAEDEGAGADAVFTWVRIRDAIRILEGL